MTMTEDVKKVVALSGPGVLGFLILAYSYCCPGLAVIPNEWNYLVERVLFMACFFGGAVTSVLALACLKSRWDELEGMFKAGMMMVNLAWIGTVIFLALHYHAMTSAH
jgi:hypothetical protein